MMRHLTDIILRGMAEPGRVRPRMLRKILRWARRSHPAGEALARELAGTRAGLAPLLDAHPDLAAFARRWVERFP